MTDTYQKPLRLYSQSTPNCIKVALALEEIAFIVCRRGCKFQYEVHRFQPSAAEKRKIEFQKMCPGGVIPVLVDPVNNENPIILWESGAAILYLAEKFNVMIPTEAAARIETIKWLFWGSATLAPQARTFGFYYNYCSERIPYCINRFRREVERLMGVLEKQLSHDKLWIMGGNFANHYISISSLMGWSDEYTLADVAIFPWIHAVHTKYVGGAWV
jgi:GST-like protein